MQPDKKFARFREPLILLCAQVLSYGIVAVAYRALSQANTVKTLASDAVYSLVQFLIIKKVANSSDNKLSMLAYGTGSVLGTWAGIVASVWWLGR